LSAQASDSDEHVLDAETAASTLDCARFDVAAEDDRAKVLDSKLTSLAAFAGLSLSISASVGGSAVAGGKLSEGFTVAVGLGLVVSAVLLLLAVRKCFTGLRLKNFESISQEAADERVSAPRLSLEPAIARANLAATYYKRILPAARTANAMKVSSVRCAYDFVGAGLTALVVTLCLTVLGAAVGE
jgi:hypothetical protein